MVESKSIDKKMGVASLEIIKNFTFEKIAKAIESKFILNHLN
jgi:hypothetical protein